MASHSWACVGNLTAGGRFTMAFARDQAMPFSGWLERVHPTLQIPLNACAGAMRHRDTR
jgi:amino acid transporter